MITLSSDRLRIFAAELLHKSGFQADEAKTIADSLTLSEMMGHSSHGLMRGIEYIKLLEQGSIVSGANLETIRETPNSLMADAQFGAGQVIMPALLEKLKNKLETQAVVTAAVRNCGHVGRLGEWVEIAAEAGYPGLLLVNDNGSAFLVAPPGGKQAVTSTNPLAFAVPLADGEIFMADLSTSAIAFGKAKVARMNGSKLPPNAIQDSDGNPTTDPEALFTNPRGSMLPMGGAQGYKGFALAMFIDLLVSGLSGGQMPPAKKGTKLINNLTMVLWNPKFFAGIAHMQEEAKKYLTFVRACPPIDPANPIRLAGDRLNTLKQDREKTGIPLGKGLTESLLTLAKKLGVTPPAELTEF